MKSPLLLGIDLEDQERLYGRKGDTRIRFATKYLLEFLNENNIKTTFFIVGDLARENNKIIEEIISSGHEIGCHSNSHITLDNLNPKKFSIDLKRNIKILKDLGAKNIFGFRAPRFSLNKQTKWAYEVLLDQGFKYSSSVLPGKTLEYGWEGLDQKPNIQNKIWEIPMTLIKTPFLGIPFGGMYFRLIPELLTKQIQSNYLSEGLPLVSYLHPYDFDYKQQKLSLNKNYLKNTLLFYNRKSTIPKLANIIQHFTPMKYIDYLNQLS